MREKKVLGIRECEVQELKAKAEKCYKCNNTYCGNCRDFVDKNEIYELVCDFEKFWNEIDHLKCVNEDLGDEIQDLNNQIYELERERDELETELVDIKERI